jgi:hypothetical protein
VGSGTEWTKKLKAVEVDLAGNKSTAKMTHFSTLISILLTSFSLTGPH